MMLKEDSAEAHVTSGWVQGFREAHLPKGS